MFVVFGILLTFSVGLLLSKINTAPFIFCRIMLSYDSLLIIVQSILLLTNFIPESPSSLIRLNKNEESKKVIALFIIPSEVDSIFK